MRRKPNLVVFINNYPGGDSVFINPELKVIKNFFSKIEIYPTRGDNDFFKDVSNDNVLISSELSNFLKNIKPLNRKIRGLFTSFFIHQVKDFAVSDISRLLNRSGFVFHFNKWISSKNFHPESTIFYSYWLTMPALALSRLKEQGKIRYFISRAHGFDLYNERGEKILNLFKPYIFANINILFCISNNGKSYLEENYPAFSEKFKISKLGIDNPQSVFTKKNSIIEIVSCSNIVHVKRIELLVEGLACFQNEHPEILIKWTHVGGGESIERLTLFCDKKLRSGSFFFTGYISIEDIFELYSTHYFDCFINVSSSEGIPVSIMQAQSAGIPVIATSVGGIPEIVNHENGLLLSPDPDPSEISSALLNLVNDESTWHEKRKNSRMNWENNFNAHNNFTEFAHAVQSLITGSK